MQYHFIDACLDAILRFLECISADSLYVPRDFQFLHLVVQECRFSDRFNGAGDFQCFHIVSGKSIFAYGFNSLWDFHVLNLLVGEHAGRNGGHTLGQLHFFDMNACLLRVGEGTAAYGCNAVRKAHFGKRCVLECGISDGLQRLREFHCLHAVLHLSGFRVHDCRECKVSDAFQLCRELYGIRSVYGTVCRRISKGAHSTGSVADCGYILTGCGLIRKYQVGIVLDLDFSAFRKTGNGGSVKGEACGIPWLLRPRFGRNVIADERLLKRVIVHVRALDLWNIEVYGAVLHTGVPLKCCVGNLFGPVRQPYGFDSIRRKSAVINYQREIRGFREVQRLYRTLSKSSCCNQLYCRRESYLLQVCISSKSAHCHIQHAFRKGYLFQIVAIERKRADKEIAPFLYAAVPIGVIGRLHILRELYGFNTH